MQPSRRGEIEGTNLWFRDEIIKECDIYHRVKQIRFKFSNNMDKIDCLFQLVHALCEVSTKYPRI